MTNIFNIKDRLKGDRMIWIILVCLSIASLLAVYSASGSLAYSYGGYSTEVYLFKQFAFICIGFGVAFFIQNIHYFKFNQWSNILLFAAIVLLIATYAWGVDINAARRWIKIPIIGLTFQSSDFAKLALLIYLAKAITDCQDQMNDMLVVAIKILAPTLIVCGLIMPADFSTAAMLFMTSFMVMFIGRVNWRVLALIVFGGLVLLAIMLAMGTYIEEIRSQTWMTRITDFFAADAEDYQIKQAKIAIAEGGIFGAGPGNSVQRNFLPSPYSDFIYAIICEEYGLIGGGFIVLIYLYLLSRCVRIVTRARKTFAALLAIGLCLSMVLQAMLNIAVSVDLVPVTGLTLPMVSKGGTSTVITCISFGIILSVSHFTEKQRKEEALAALTANEDSEIENNKSDEFEGDH